MKEFIDLGINDETLASQDYYICIHSTGWIHSIPVFKHNHKNVLNLWFDDVEVTGLKTITWFNNTQRTIFATACSDDTAKQIINFISSIPANSTIHVYCAKGRSRSVAVANYIRQFVNNEDIADSGHNNHVFNLLKRHTNV